MFFLKHPSQPSIQLKDYLKHRASDLTCSKSGSRLSNGPESHNLCTQLDFPKLQPIFKFSTLPDYIINPNKTKALIMFYTLFEKRPYINYVRRIQIYTRFHQSVNGIVNITLKIWYHEEDRCMTKEYLQLSHMIYLYWRWIYTYIHVHVHIHTYVHTYTHIYTYICIKCF